MSASALLRRCHQRNISGKPLPIQPWRQMPLAQSKTVEVWRKQQLPGCLKCLGHCGSSCLYRSPSVNQENSLQKDWIAWFFTSFWLWYILATSVAIQVRSRGFIWKGSQPYVRWSWSQLMNIYFSWLKLSSQKDLQRLDLAQWRTSPSSQVRSHQCSHCRKGAPGRGEVGVWRGRKGRKGHQPGLHLL